MRFMPCWPAQMAVSREPDPHQMRRSRPGDWGCTGSRKPSEGRPPWSAATTGRPAIAARNSFVFSRAKSASLWPSAGAYPNASAPRQAGSGEPLLIPSCRRPPLIRSATADSSAM
jgi:hypothetical protein